MAESGDPGAFVGTSGPASNEAGASPEAAGAIC